MTTVLSSPFLPSLLLSGSTRNPRLQVPSLLPPGVMQAFILISRKKGPAFPLTHSGLLYKTVVTGVVPSPPRLNTALHLNIHISICIYRAEGVIQHSYRSSICFYPNAWDIEHYNQHVFTFRHDR